MSDVHRFRMAMAKHLGKMVTPEVAAAIETEAFFVPDRSVDPSRFAPHEYRGYIFALESLRLIVEELHALHEAHFVLTEKARAGVPLNPDYEYMAAAERAGTLMQFTVRKDGELVGNARFYTYRDLHTQTPGAREDTIFVKAEHRIGWMPVRFMQYVERCIAQHLGDCDIWTDSKIVRDEQGALILDIGRFNEYLGFTHEANRWHKRVTKE